jgi:hypothetical protein
MLTLIELAPHSFRYKYLKKILTLYQPGSTGKNRSLSQVPLYICPLITMVGVHRKSRNDKGKNDAQTTIPVGGGGCMSISPYANIYGRLDSLLPIHFW